MPIFYVTKNALTGGILEVEAEEPINGSNILYWKDCHGIKRYVFKEGNQWHRTREAAVACAERMRKARIASMKKQFVKLERMMFR